MGTERALIVLQRLGVGTGAVDYQSRSTRRVQRDHLETQMPFRLAAAPRFLRIRR